MRDVLLLNMQMSCSSLYVELLPLAKYVSFLIKLYMYMIYVFEQENEESSFVTVPKQKEKMSRGRILFSPAPFCNIFFLKSTMSHESCLRVILALIKLHIY